MKKKVSSLLFICIFILNLFTGCGSETTTSTSKSAFYFDTIVTITLYEDEETASELFDGCFALAEKYESMFSTTLEGSDIYRINHAAGAAVTVDEETITLIQTGIAYAKASDGAFDITVGALSDLWDFSNNEGEIPSEEEIADALSTVSYQNIIIDGNTVSLSNPETQIDLGGIAKGYIADQMKAYLLEQGVTSALINLGGNVLCVGEKVDGSDYQIGIQEPFSEDGEVIASVSVSDKSVVTSGTYQRYFEVNGEIYHHILDLSTGYPCNSGLSSVTIISETSIEGDALSTTVFLMGLEDGLAYVESLENVEAIFISDDGTITTTSNMGDQLVVTQ